MATLFSKFIRPEEVERGQITDRDLDILDAVLRYRFVSAAQLVRIVGGNEDVTHRRLRRLWEWHLVNRWAFPGIRTHSEFYYYLDNQTSLKLLAEHRALDIHAHMLEEVRNNREKIMLVQLSGGSTCSWAFCSTASWSSVCISSLNYPVRNRQGKRSWCPGCRERH